MRAIGRMDLPGIVPAPVGAAPPRFREVDPATLLVDEDYQRNLSTRSVRLIGRIVSEWSWAAFKPPVVVDVDGALHVVDGQHTAIGAATHPDIAAIPVMVVEAPEETSRADAFVRHNRDRISVTPTQLHFAQVAAANEDALTVHQVCGRAKVTILRAQPGNGRFRVGDTLAIGALQSLVARRHAMGARKVLDVCVAARLAPISATDIKAVDHLLNGEQYAGQITVEDVSSILLDRAPLEREAARFAAERGVPAWRALASVVFMRKERRRG